MYKLLDTETQRFKLMNRDQTKHMPELQINNLNDYIVDKVVIEEVRKNNQFCDTCIKNEELNFGLSQRNSINNFQD